nr:hypothetical protein [Tanacetum cinerariifolium]
MVDAKLAHRVSMSSLTNSICSCGGTATGDGDGSSDGDTDGGSDGEDDLDLLRDEDGKSDGGCEDDDGKSDGDDDDGKSGGGDVKISILGRQAKTGLVDKGRVGGEWTVTQRSHLDPRLMSRRQNPVGSHTKSTDGEAMIISIKNGDQPLPRVTQVSIAGTTSIEQPPLKDRDVLTVASTMRIPLLYRGEYSQW